MKALEKLTGVKVRESDGAQYRSRGAGSEPSRGAILGASFLPPEATENQRPNSCDDKQPDAPIHNPGGARSPVRSRVPHVLLAKEDLVASDKVAFLIVSLGLI